MRINKNDVLVNIAKLIKVARMNERDFCPVSGTRYQYNMIWTTWHNKATMLTPAPMPMARWFAYEYYMRYPTNLSWIPFSCLARTIGRRTIDLSVRYIKSHLQLCVRIAACQLTKTIEIHFKYTPYESLHYFG